MALRAAAGNLAETATERQVVQALPMQALAAQLERRVVSLGLVSSEEATEIVGGRRPALLQLKPVQAFALLRANLMVRFRSGDR